jgi:hypothetical protein
MDWELIPFSLGLVSIGILMLIFRKQLANAFSFSERERTRKRFALPRLLERLAERLNPRSEVEALWIWIPMGIIYIVLGASMLVVCLVTGN